MGFGIIRENWLSNRGFHDHDEIVDHRCLGWNRPIDQEPTSSNAAPGLARIPSAFILQHVLPRNAHAGSRIE